MPHTSPQPRSRFRTTLRRSGLLLATIILLTWLFGLPRPLFQLPYATLLQDPSGQLLGARIATDGQWRFPPADSIPHKFAQCLVQFEDRRFWQHWGIDLRALLRATQQNIKAGRIVSGASTLDMQVIRMARKRSSRSLPQKLIELGLALRLQLSYNKEDILACWANQAPYGGNVVGLEAASWRYYQKPPQLLSWAEAAMLAVLPNSPALIHPGRNRRALQQKRNRLLLRLQEENIIDSSSYQLALLEPIPESPLPLPQLAPHLLDRVAAQRGPGRWTVSLQADLQARLQQISISFQQQLAANSIHNLAILVLDNEHQSTLAYIGNVPGLANVHSPQVDLIQAARSPGSLLKPILYGLALENNTLLPKQLLTDIPTVFGGFRPENFHQNYSGATPADQALARSLNIPFVHLLKQYGIGPFHAALQNWDFDFIRQAPAHYGLSLILGGAEVSLWQISSWYSGLARTLNQYRPLQSRYAINNWDAPNYLLSSNANTLPIATQSAAKGIGAGAAWATISALEQLQRPASEGQWKTFTSSRRLAWKTGTSFGFRDAWAVGISPRYTIGVWVGNADGEGRPGLVGIQAAAPLLFAVLRQLPAENTPWFEPPYDDLSQAQICTQSGYLTGQDCPTSQQWIPQSGQHAKLCPHHQRIFTDASAQQRLQQACVASTNDLYAQAWFSLPPLQAHYYQLQHPAYRPIPPWRADCRPNNSSEAPLAWIYPSQSGNIKIPRTWDGQLSAIIFSVTHREAGKRLHWHLDDQFIGTTTQTHKQEIRPNPGPHRILVEDEDGHRIWRDFVLE